MENYIGNVKGGKRKEGCSRMKGLSHGSAGLPVSSSGSEEISSACLSTFSSPVPDRLLLLCCSSFFVSSAIFKGAGTEERLRF